MLGLKLSFLFFFFFVFLLSSLLRLLILLILLFQGLVVDMTGFNFLFNTQSLKILAFQRKQGCCLFIYISSWNLPWYQSIQPFFHHGFYVPYEMQQYSLNRKRHKFAYLTIENNSFARFARTFHFWTFCKRSHFLSMTWNDLFCSCVDEVGI